MNQGRRCEPAFTYDADRERFVETLATAGRMAERGQREHAAVSLAA
jgi:hypothetical protein